MIAIVAFLISTALSGVDSDVPLSIIQYGVAWDGGTISAEVADSTGVSVRFCIDRRIMQDRSQRGKLWLDALYPTCEGARVAGPQEIERILALLRAIEIAMVARADSVQSGPSIDGDPVFDVELARHLIWAVETGGHVDTTTVRRHSE